MPYRVATPPEPDPPELEEPYAAVLRAQRRRARLLMASALAVVFAAGGARAAWTGASRGETQASEAARAALLRRDRAHDAIASARLRAAAAQARFDRTMHAAVASGLRPRPDLGACPTTLPVAHLPVWGRSAFPLLVVKLAPADLDAPLPSQAIADMLADVRRAEQHLDAGRYEEATLYARALDRPQRLGREVVLFTRDGETRPPEAVSGGAFQPGAVAGTAYLYDFADDTVTCAGTVAAGSSAEIGYAYSDRVDAPVSLGARASMSDALEEDLRVQVEKAVVTSLRFRVGP